MLCETCGLECSGRFCSKKCYKMWHYRAHYRVALICSRCGESYQGYCKTKVPICSFCRSKHLHRGGPESPTWRGGHRYWSPGRHGKDKDGLFWKVQRRLAWERDQLICQGCGLKKSGWRPDVHHIKPYRVSHSHALDNLICLCKSCHKKRDSREVAMGNLSPVYPSVLRVVCRSCGSRTRKLNSEGWCGPCRTDRLIKEAQKLRDQGSSYEEIARSVGVTHKAVWRWLNGGLKRSRLIETECDCAAVA